MEEKKILNDCIKQEEELRFHDISRSDVWRLGNILIEIGREQVKPVAIEIKINGLILFSYYPEGTSLFYQTMLNRKHNTVNYMEKSSLRFWAETQISGVDPETAMHLSPEQFQFRGGGFPIRLKSGMVIGSVAVSGMDHTVDHAIAVAGIKEFLQIKDKETI